MSTEVVPQDQALVLSVRDLGAAYGRAVALRGVDMDVSAGQVVAVLGTNGAGKSTLARACAGLVPARTGRITWKGQDATRWSAHRMRRAGLLYLPEGRGIFPGLTVHENLCLAASLVRGKSARGAAIGKAIELFPILGERGKQPAGALSGGEQQRLSLVRATVVVPSLIIADELSLGLAPQIVDTVFSYLADLRKEHGVGIVLIEQFVHRALALADNCLILRRGTVSWTGPAEDGAVAALATYMGVEADR